MRDGFIIHELTMSQVDRMSDDQAGALLKALIAKYNESDTPDMDLATEMVYIGAAERMDADAAKYKKVCDARAEAGKKGAETRWQKMANDSKAMICHSEKMAKMADTDSDSVSDTDTDKKNNKKKSAKRFTPPTVEEVTAYCKFRGNNVNPEAFVSFYESKGWKVGTSPMRNWKAAIVNWEQREARGPTQVVVHKKENPFTNYTQRDTDWNELQRQILRRG